MPAPVLSDDLLVPCSWCRRPIEFLVNPAHPLAAAYPRCQHHVGGFVRCSRTGDCRDSALEQGLPWPGPSA